jgi:hypothetical protein
LDSARPLDLQTRITAEECGGVRWPTLGCDKDGFILYTEEDRLVFHPISDMEKIFKYG